MKKNYFRFFKLLAFFPILIGAQVNFPYTENFGGSTTQSQWDYSNPSTIVVENTSVNSPNGGTGGSLMYNFYNSAGLSTYNVKSPVFNNSTNGQVGVSFQFAAANRYTMPVALQTVFADDHILLEYSTDGGQTYTLAHDYEIGKSGELNTGGITSSIFTPNATQWVTKNILLPAGTNRVNFKGIKNNVNQAGNFAYLDHVIFEICDGSTPAPTGNSSQVFCSSQTLTDLIVSGSNIKWYTDATGGTLLPANTVLVSGTTYYASQVVGACESTTRLAVTVNSSGCLAVNEVGNSKDFSFYPNPVEDVLHINSKINVVKLNVYAVDGKLVLSEQGKGISSMRMNKLIRGNYFVEFTFENGKTYQTKIIKK
ncbi:T9SS type A sorting domain-containing protein [Chryseobacterium oryctis]|uniref:T9SS type A sorting domain-containing protein n=1 Tax=Chryseobacterium oryctis TaxID=2952618 RepID=A0ABT3HJ55_9FLAO|nr:T9SS type A sorting domain-containing protein [Chryseobacterium oryctis]MCW3159807.1 T9SS type A sorting domain-containing protein [Chryseobacterium oryctis]